MTLREIFITLPFLQIIHHCRKEKVERRRFLLHHQTTLPLPRVFQCHPLSKVRSGRNTRYLLTIDPAVRESLSKRPSHSLHSLAASVASSAFSSSETCSFSQRGLRKNQLKDSCATFYSFRPTCTYSAEMEAHCSLCVTVTPSINTSLRDRSMNLPYLDNIN